MTVIAWDGKTLAADKRATNCGMAYTVTKVHRLPDGLVAFSGGAGHAGELLNWFLGSRDPATYPRYKEDDGAGAFRVSEDGKIHIYCSASPFPEIVEQPFFARGSGRDFALMAMHLGKSAQEAVELTSLFDSGCGNGVDALTLG